MAISFVGQTSNNTTDGTDVTIDLSVLSLAQNDVVYAFGGLSTAAPATPTGWTQVSTVGFGSGAMRVWRKVMGATPDSSVTLDGSGIGVLGQAYSVYAFRGVDTSTPEDVTPTTATGTSTTPDPPSIDPVTDNCAVLACGAISINVTAGPSGYSNFVNELGDGSGGDNSAYGAFKILTGSAAEDPGTFTAASSLGWSTTSVAIRPAASGDATVTVPNAASVNLNANTPVVQASGVVEPSAATLAFSPQTPAFGQGVQARPGSASLLISQPTPDIARVMSPANASLLVSPQVPVLDVDRNVNIGNAASINLSPQTPVIAASAIIEPTPASINLNIEGVDVDGRFSLGPRGSVSYGPGVSPDKGVSDDREGVGFKGVVEQKEEFE